MFEATGEGSTTVIQNTLIGENVADAPYQIFRITDGAAGRLLNSTIQLNSPVEVRHVRNEVRVTNLFF